MKAQHFTHRPLSAGVHLLSDPPPQRVASGQTENQNLTSSKRSVLQSKVKKSGLRS